MKIAVLADIHSNYRALQAVADDIERWRPDMVVVAGDVINRGPMPVECLSFAREMEREEGWLLLRGNHEDYVIEHAQPSPEKMDGVKGEIFRLSWWTYEQLEKDVSVIEAWPFCIERETPGGLARFTHASMRGIRDGIYRQLPDDILCKQIGEPPPALFVVGHTHLPLVRPIGQTLVVNVGAVGLPFDGDTRAAYAQIVFADGAWKAEIKRLTYDFARAERDYHESGFLDEAGPLAELVLDEQRRGRSNLFQWMELYYQDILAGKLSVEEATRRFLQIPPNQRRVYG
ncbi:MAG TPA: metallophosphoesterase family protein [Thermoflexales bacterium]|nr:metallophosphoesterase family protein [Thermoflexales bacterium]